MLPYTPTADNDLLIDLLAASERLYHRNVAIIQRVFVEQFFQTIARRERGGELLSAEELVPYRRALKLKLGELIQAQQALRQQRDANVRQYIASRCASRPAA